MVGFFAARTAATTHGSSSRVDCSGFDLLQGAGGMGEVYRARDLKLGRDVAIKVLPAAPCNDTNYRARFQREAQVLASLNHPNIAAIYGLEENAIVMELVEGENLCGPLPVDEALRIARYIVEALETAHDKGHRPSRFEAGEHQGHAVEPPVPGRERESQ